MTTRSALLSAWLACLWWLAWLSSAAAGGPSRVAVIKPQGDDAEVAEASVRVAAELHAAGFEVVELEVEPGLDPRAKVESTKLDPPPFATIAIVKTDAGTAADVWVADHLTAKTSVRRIERASASASGLPGELAIRAVELLRASLLELRDAPEGSMAQLPEDVARWVGSRSVVAQPAPAPAQALLPAPPPALLPAPSQAVEPSVVLESAPPPSPEPWRAPDPASRSGLDERVTLALELAALIGVRGYGVAFAPALRVGIPLAYHLVLRAGVAATLAPTAVEGSIGSAALHQQLALVELGSTFGVDGVLVPFAALGVGAYHVNIAGSASPPHSAHDEDAWAFALALGAGAAIRLSERWAIVFDAQALVAFPEVVVRIGEENVARGGLPMLHLGGGGLVAF